MAEPRSASDGASSETNSYVPVVNFRPILPGINSNLFRSSAPESAAIKVDGNDEELNVAERFILKEANVILDLRKANEGNGPLKEKMIETGFEVHADKIPESFRTEKRYIIQLDYLGKGDELMAFIDKTWLGPDELLGLGEKEVYMKRRSSFNNQGLTGLNILLLERKASMLQALKVVTQYLEQAPEGKMLIHCTAGKDRTGMICMMMQSVAGFTTEQLIEEYTISETQAKHVVAQAVKDHENSFIDVKIMSGADKAGIDGALSHLRSNYGSIESYLDEIGFDVVWRERLKRVMVK